MNEKTPEERTNPAKRDSHALLDDSTLDALENVPHEEPFLTELGQGGESDGIVNEISKWLPREDSWKGKTHIHHEQARPLSLALHISHVYPELEEIQENINSIIRDYLELTTSIDGVSRDQQLEVLSSQYMHDPETQSTTVMYGDNNDDDSGWF